MATWQRFNSFVEAAMEKKHNLASDTLKCVLSLTAPNVTNEVLADITQIAAGNGYSTGGFAVTVTSATQTGGVYKLVLADATITASGGAIADFRYATIYNDTATNDELIGFVDYGSTLTLADTQSFTLDFSSTLGAFTIP